MGDLHRGRVFRVTPKGHTGYEVPKYDYTTADGAVAALKNPSYAVRYIAFTALHEMGRDAEDALKKLHASKNPVFRARALWLLGKIAGRGQIYVDRALADEDARIRMVGLRLARQLKLDIEPLIEKLATDSDAAVRRECAIALRPLNSNKAVKLWSQLAQQHDGEDRWYLEALGIGADGKWDACFSEWQSTVGENWITKAGRDIIWRSRAAQAPELIAKVIKHKDTPEEEKARYFRALDFHSGAAKEKALQSLLLP